MGKIAFVFPGQGAQYPGMGLELAAASPAARAVFHMADAMRPGTSSHCFNGSEELLRKTKVTQPCIWTVEMAAAAALEERGIHADMAAGFSLGELAALSYAKVVDEATCFRLVCERGRLMYQAVQVEDTAMAVVVKLDNETVERLCARFDRVYPVNYSCPGQVTVAGPKNQMNAFAAAVREEKGTVLPLKIGGGFSSPFMKEASTWFGYLMKPVDFALPVIPLYSNMTGRPYGGDMKRLLQMQMCSPVRWETIIRNMIAAGADTFVEVGPGNALQDLIRRIDDSVRVFGVSDAASLQRTVQEIGLC